MSSEARLLTGEVDIFQEVKAVSLFRFKHAQVTTIQKISKKTSMSCVFPQNWHVMECGNW